MSSSAPSNSNNNNDDNNSNSHNNDKKANENNPNERKRNRADGDDDSRPKKRQNASNSSEDSAEIRQVGRSALLSIRGRIIARLQSPALPASSKKKEFFLNHAPASKVRGPKPDLDRLILTAKPFNMPELQVTKNARHYFLVPSGTTANTSDLPTDGMQRHCTLTFYAEENGTVCYDLYVPCCIAGTFKLIFKYQGKETKVPVKCVESSRTPEKKMSLEQGDTPSPLLPVEINARWNSRVLVLVPKPLREFFAKQFHVAFPNGKYGPHSYLFVKDDPYLHYCVRVEAVEEISLGLLRGASQMAAQILLVLENPDQNEDIVNVLSIKDFELEFNKKGGEGSVVNQVDPGVFHGSIRKIFRDIQQLQLNSPGLVLGCFLVKPNLQHSQLLERTIIEWPEITGSTNTGTVCFCATFNEMPGVNQMQVAQATIEVLNDSSNDPTLSLLAKSSIVVFFEAPVTLLWAIETQFNYFVQRFEEHGLQLKSMGLATRQHVAQLMKLKVNEPIREELFDFYCRLHAVNPNDEVLEAPRREYEWHAKPNRMDITTLVDTQTITPMDTKEDFLAMIAPEE